VHAGELFGIEALLHGLERFADKVDLAVFAEFDPVAIGLDPP
jgi:hypothetical protein